MKQLVDGRPWGHGASRVETPTLSWRCPECGWTATPRNVKQRAIHVYPSGDERCTPCARAWCERNWP